LSYSTKFAKRIQVKQRKHPLIWLKILL